MLYYRRGAKVLKTNSLLKDTQISNSGEFQPQRGKIFKLCVGPSKSEQAVEPELSVTKSNIT